GGVRENPKGEPGLVGYSDFYREQPRSSGISFIKKDEKGNEIKSTPSVIADTNIGYMRVHEKYKGGGIGRQMFDYMHKTTPEGSILNVGKAASNETLHMSEKLSKEKPGSVKYKLF
ncbi:MAG: hypothetical protein EBU08_22095, partial [Micrococcales bacterium]|nr:hypothetical protein [Micrococcales bacterium]